MRFVGYGMLRGAAHVIFSTRREREKAAQLYSGPNTRVVRWPVASVDLGDRERVRNRVREELGVPVDAKILIALGRVHAMKRPLETIEAIARARVSGLHLLVVGPEEGITREQCESHARALGFDRLHVLGPVFGKRKDELLLASDGFISLSTRENFGHSAAESMSANLPVILSPGNDLIGELNGVHCGWFLTDDSVETAIGAIRSFAGAESETLLNMGQNGREWVCRELSFDNFRLQLQMLAREAVECHRRR